jgi:hypothetical protein
MKAFKRLDRQTERRMKIEIQKELEKQRDENVRRIFKLFCVALNQQYGFGKIRSTRLIMKVAELIEQSKTDEIFWYHIDKKVIDSMGILFDREDYEEWDK